MRGLAPAKKILIATANRILANDHPQTLRQLHYRIFSLKMDGYHNDKASYRGLCRILTNERRRDRQWELLRKDWTRTAEDHANAKKFGICVDVAIEALKVASLTGELFEQVKSRKRAVDEVVALQTAIYHHKK